MIDFGFDKIALIGVVALVVLGPEKLPKVARTVGHLVGKAQRYVADVKAEVNRSIELDELKKMRTDFESAARDVGQSVQREISDASAAFDRQWRDAQALPDGAVDPAGLGEADAMTPASPWSTPAPYVPPRKNWRLRRTAMPHWYKQHHGVRTKAQSGAARVARFRPRPGNRSSA